jgi:Ca2+/Na+ antiporter
MILDLYKISAILGLICIILGITITKTSQKRKQYVLFILGGILLEIYSLRIKDTIFIILQAVFTLSAIIELSMLYKRAKKLEKSIEQYLIDLESHIIKFHKRK